MQLGIAELRSCQPRRKVEVGYNPSHTTETLIGYTAYWTKSHLRGIAFSKITDSFRYSGIIHKKKSYMRKKCGFTIVEQAIALFPKSEIGQNKTHVIA